MTFKDYTKLKDTARSMTPLCPNTENFNPKISAKSNFLFKIALT